MKFGVAFSTIGPAVEPEGLALVARTAEELGYESVWSVEHVVIPVGYTSRYPYSPSGRIDSGEATDLPDPIVPLAFVAAQTTRIKLGTAAVVLPEHHPLRLAKAVATLDRLSSGRAILGVGAGWLREEYEALGIDFDSRGRRAEASIAALRQLWGPGPSSFESEFFSWPPVESNPKPAQPGGVPIHIAGHAPVVARRGARIADGFMPGVNTPEAFESIVDVLRTECDRIGRDPDEIELTVCCTGSPSAEDVRAYAERGASRVHTVAIAATATEVCAQMAEYASTVMAEVGSEAPV